MTKASLIAMVAAASFLASPAAAQKAPEAGYIFPPGGKAGTTVEVRVGGYDWTPDMEFFTLDKRVQLIPSGPPGPILIPPPPYWFGAKSRIVALPLAREVPAKIVIPADVPAGPVFWQAANANGSTLPGVFIVGTGPEVVEEERRKSPQLLSGLPMTVSGRLFKNEEVDRYRFIAAKDGPITCDLMARRLGSKFVALLEVHDSAGRIVADSLGTSAQDAGLTFIAKAGMEYVVSLHDIDFGGDRSFVYRLAITSGPRVMGALPAAGRRGETCTVEFVGLGLVTGAAKLESVKRTVTFPTTGTTFDYRLDTPFGMAFPFPLLVSDLPEVDSTRTGPGRMAAPVGITGALDQPDAEDLYSFTWKKGETWSLELQGRGIGSPLDVALTVFGPGASKPAVARVAGGQADPPVPPKEFARSDDLPDTTDAGLDFVVPADGTYQVVVSDMAGKSGSRAAIYRLVVRPIEADFVLQLPAQRVSVPLDDKFDLKVKAVRRGSFKGPIALTVRGLPAGISVPAGLVIPADKAELSVPLQGAKDAATAAGFATIEGSALVGAATVTRTASARITTNLAPQRVEENQVAGLTVAATLKPRFKGRPVDQDTGRKVHRGSTFPADVLIERLDGFNGEIVLQMAAQQSYQVQGITGNEVIVPPGAKAAIYPCYMPEWLETTRTSRLGMVGVAKVADPKGKVRYLVSGMGGFITMTMEGALLKISSEENEAPVPANQPFDVRLRISRLTKLKGPVQLELRLPNELTGLIQADPMTLTEEKETALFRVTPASSLTGMHTFSIRATALQDGRYPVISEASVSVDILPAARGNR